MISKTSCHDKLKEEVMCMRYLPLLPLCVFDSSAIFPTNHCYKQCRAEERENRILTSRDCDKITELCSLHNYQLSQERKSTCSVGKEDLKALFVSLPGIHCIIQAFVFTGSPLAVCSAARNRAFLIQIFKA